VGLSNRLSGQLSTGAVEVLGTRLPLVDPVGAPKDSAAVTALVRPEAVDVVADAAGVGRVLAASFLGPTSRVTVALPDDVLVVAQVASARLVELAPGTAVRVELHAVPTALA
jgi:putative spermidine/putrescine transport system ATP-binding protein